MKDNEPTERQSPSAPQKDETAVRRAKKLKAIARKINTLFLRNNPSPYCEPNTFFVWEPCTHSHAEVVPGYCKILLDLGYEVSVLLEPARIKEGLFAHFTHERLHINKLSRRATKRFFKEHGLATASGILVTTAGKLSADADYEQACAQFGGLAKKQKVLLVEHDIQKGADLGTLTSDIITLRQTNYQDSVTTPVNPHYFGEFEDHCKNQQTVFATAGALRDKRRNAKLLIGAVEQLHQKGIRSFSVLMIGKSESAAIPRHLKRYFLQLGRLDFCELYRYIQNCDFLLPLLDPNNELHRRYISTGTSGTFQLSLGFKKPLIIEDTFAAINRLDTANSIIYRSNNNLQAAMERAIEMTPEEYETMREAVAETAREIYLESLANLKSLL